MWDFTKYQDRISAIDEKGRQISYEELDEKMAEFAAHIEKRCLIFIFCNNQIGNLTGYAGCIQHHIVPLMLPGNLDANLSQDLIEKYHPRFIWKPAAMKEEGESCVYTADEYVLIRTKFEDEVELNDDLALLLTTSGSTGSQKLVRISYLNLESNTRNIVTYLKLNQEERPILALPMNYTFGLSIVNTHLYVGATLLLTSKKVIQKSFWKFFNDYGGTSFSGVPYTYEVLEKIHFFQMEQKTLKTLTQAGGKLSVRLQKNYAAYAQDKNIKFVVMYGQTEATARISYLPPEKCLLKTGSIGIPIPEGKIRIFDEQGRCIETPRKEGELVYEGQNVTLGYAENSKDLMKGDERNGILHTGDIGYFDEDGYFYISGRKDRYMKVLGNRVSLDEIENIIRTGMSGIDIACVGKEEKIYIYMTDLQRQEEVVHYIAQKTNLNRTVFKAVPIVKIPRNESGKIRYRKLAEAIG